MAKAILRCALLLLMAVLILSVSVLSVTRLPSADGQFWDIQDTSIWSQDSGGIATGGRANPFDGFGYLKLQVRRPDRSPIVINRYLRGFGLAHDGAERFDSITPVMEGGVVVSRSIFAPRDTNYLRYFDSFTNVESEARIVEVAWGGAAGGYEDGGLVSVAASSNGDRRIDRSDSFVTVMQNARKVAEPWGGPSGHGPSAHVLGTKTAGLRTFTGDMYADPFKDAWPGFNPAHIGYVFTFTIAPGQTVALVTFVVKGLSEVYDPRGGSPMPSLPDGIVQPRFQQPYTGPDAKIPAAGSEIAKVTEAARKLVADPDLRGLTPRQRSQVINWQLSAALQVQPFTVFEKTAPQLQDAMTHGEISSVREIAIVLDQVAGTDPEDPVTAEANARIKGSFADSLNPANLKGARIGFLRQRFVGFTGEREIATMMDRVRQELVEAGATVLDISIPDLDAKYAVSRGSVPGSLKEAWNAYLARGSKAGEKVITIDDLLASGKLAPASASRFRNALQPAPAGAALDQATRQFNRTREQFRDVYVTAMDQERLDALIYPGNHARPHTHEGGLERYGSEPGTCEDSAYTGLPQVTVPAGFIGSRYPFGISFLGRLWDDGRLLGLAFAYEQATHHRKPPATVK